MSETQPALPDFANIRDILDSQRKIIIKINEITDDEYVRVIDDAGLILDFLESISTKLWSFFNENPSLIYLFESEFTSINEFFSRQFILDTCFLEDCLFPEKESFIFGQDGGLSDDILNIHENHFDKWMNEKLTLHNDTLNLVKNNFHEEIKQDHLGCKCRICIADFRSSLRDFIFKESKKNIDECVLNISENMNNGVAEISETYKSMKKRVDKLLYRVRHQLKRSTINRLESQLKGIYKDNFSFPSELAVRYVGIIRPSLLYFLEEEGLNESLVNTEELEKFYRQLHNNLWKNEKFIIAEFKKYVRSIMFLKRKDISSKILNEYLGEFWVYAKAREIKRKIVYHMGPTNSGKTYHAVQALSEAGTGCYLAPLRLLAGELYDTLKQKGVKTTLLTGEEVIESEDATHISSTIEMARFQQIFDCVVIDEIQMITDSQRGWAWTRALVNIYSPVVHVCGDRSAFELVKEVTRLCGDELEVKNYERMTKLEVMNRTIDLRQLEPSDALIVFSRRNALKFKSELEKEGHRVSIIYGRLSPEVRREQARKFDEKETDIIVSTDAISMGMNLPIKRIVFSTLSKFINSKEHVITESEIKQIAGRAGRYQKFPTGYVTCLPKVDGGIEKIKDAMGHELSQSTKCMVGPDLDIFSQINNALEGNSLQTLKLSEFLRLFYTMNFKEPFFCVEFTEMIELSELVEEADKNGLLTSAEIFGFACAPVNFGLMEHMQFFVSILNNYVLEKPIKNEPIDYHSTDIDYLETSIKCVELYQWLARHFDNKNFEFLESELLHNKSLAIEKLNELLSEKMIPFDKGGFRRGGNRSGNRSYKKKGGSKKDSKQNRKRNISVKRKSTKKKKGGYRGKSGKPSGNRK